MYLIKIGDQDHNHDEKHKTKEVLLKEGQEDGPIKDGDQDESATKLVQQIESANSNDNDNDNQEFMNIFRRVLAKELKLSPIHEVEEEEGYLASQSASAASDNSDSATSEDEGNVLVTQCCTIGKSSGAGSKKKKY